MKRVLLIPWLHPVNVGFYWLLSGVCRIEAYLVHPACFRFLHRQLTWLDFNEYLSHDEVPYFRSKVVGCWEHLAPGVETRRWRLTIGGCNLDYSGKAKQELAKDYEVLLLLGEAQRRQRDGRRAWVIESASMRYLRGLPGAENVPFPRAVTWLSTIHRMSDFLFLHGQNLTRAIRTGLMLVDGMVQQWTNRRPILQPGARCIYHAMNPNEMSLSRDERSAVWVADGERVTSRDVLFVMPLRVDPTVQQAFRQSPYQVFSVRELVSRMPADGLRRSLTSLIGFMCAYPFHVTGGVPGVNRVAYALNLFTWKPIMEHLKPRAYVISLGNLNVEDPAIVYFNAVGVRTIMYCFAANSYLFASKGGGCDFRAVLFSHLLVSTIVVWHQDYRQFLESHPQEGVDIRVIGPLMAGDERVVARDVGELREAYGITPRDRAQELRVVTAFDVAAILKRHMPNSGIYAHPYPEDYIAAFLRDMVRLLNERQDILLVYKPQRDMTKAKYRPSEEYVGLVQALREHPRAVVVKDTINPWVPIAVAELSIAMPFTSPALAALHYGQPAIYHDPLNRCRYHRYEPLEGNTITHSYEALYAKVEERLARRAARPAGGGPWLQEALPYIGSHPGTNSTERFQAMLVPPVRRPETGRSAWHADEGGPWTEPVRTPAVGRL